jgi:hypothetical protein
MHKKRRASLDDNVFSALTGTRLTVTDLGRSIDSLAKQKHCIKRSDRLLSNGHLHRERNSIYGAIIRYLVGNIKRPLIIVDWSDMDEYKHHYLLRASLAVEGRSFTLYEEVHTVLSKEKPKTHLDFLSTFKDLLPEDCYPIIVSDAGFRVPWFRQVESFGWDWIGRVRNRTLIQLENDDSWQSCKGLYALATKTPKKLGAARMARNNPIDCQLIIFKGVPKGRIDKNCLGKKAMNSRSRQHAKSAKEPWLLASSLPSLSTLAKKVVEAYTLRMQIEESFRDLKSTRFGLSLEMHLTYREDRLQVMLLIAALALMVAWLMGKATEVTEQHWQYQANTIRTRRVLSTIFIGHKMLGDRRTRLTVRDMIVAWITLQDIIQSHCVFELIDERSNNMKLAG